MSRRAVLSALPVVVSLLGQPAVEASSEREETLINRNTTLNLIEALVQKGILDRKSADAMIRDAKAKAVTDARAELAREPASAVPVPAGQTSQHVAYVPEIVKDEIREKVRQELKEQVTADVKAQAKAEKWGIPAALPDWVSRIKPYFDLRLRVSDEFYGDGNAPYWDWSAINRLGGQSQALARNEAFLNTTIDRFRLRERFRIGFDADITESLKAGFRFATSNLNNPVSNNQTLGNTGQSYQIAIDRAFLQYDHPASTGLHAFSLYAGRIPNPFVSTDVVFDPDLSFEGLAGAARFGFNRADPAVAAYHPHNPTARAGINTGPHVPDSVFVTGGVFPLQEVNLSSRDKWLFGGQMGADWLMPDDSRLTVAGSYYHFRNIEAQRNPFDRLSYDWTAPQFMQKGNSLVSINDAANQTACNTGSLGAQNICLVGLASGFKVVNATLVYDFARFAPTHVQLTLDYARNLGFDRQRILREFGSDIRPRTSAYQVRVDAGRAEVRKFKDWNLYFAYRYIERDAVLDAFTDSVFHQGGTNARGWVLGAQYALAANTWLNFRWFNTDVIDGPPLSIDTATMDLNARF